jgi:hypothetical protein
MVQRADALKSLINQFPDLTFYFSRSIDHKEDGCQGNRTRND